MNFPQSIRGRLLALAAVWLTLALIGAYLVIGAVLERFVTQRFDAELSAVADRVTAAATLDASGQVAIGIVSDDPRFVTPMSGWYWQLEQSGRSVAKSPSLFDATLSGPTGPMGEVLRVQSRDLSLPETGGLTLTVTAPQSDIDAALAAVNRPLALSLMVLGLGLAAATMVQVSAGLSALDRLGRDIRRVRDGTIDTLPPVTAPELRAPSDELNALLAENRAVLERTREHLGNLAHSLKTPLAALGNTLPADHPGHSLIARMDQQIGWHLRRARADGGTRRSALRTSVEETVSDILLVLNRPITDRGLIVDLALAPNATFAGDRQDLQEMLGNLMENAVKWANARIRVSAKMADGRLILTVSDDGPGMADKDHAHALSRGGRLDETGPAGSGLGLGIVVDLVRLHGGTLNLGRSDDLGGLSAALTLPG